MENVNRLEEVQKTLARIGSTLEKIHTITICLHHYCYATILCDGLYLMMTYWKKHEAQ